MYCGISSVIETSSENGDFHRCILFVCKNWWVNT